MEVGLPSADTDADIVTRIAMLTLRGPNHTLEPTGLGLDHHRDHVGRRLSVSVRRDINEKRPYL